MKKEKSIKKSDKNIENRQEEVLKANEPSEENREKINLLIQQQTSYSGPLPHPKMLEEYKRIYKDAPEIIFTVFQREQENRFKTIRFGQISALIIGIGGLISTTLLGIYGNPVVAGCVGFFSLGSLVGAFLYGKNKK